jgi:hypothetical protein
MKKKPKPKSRTIPFAAIPSINRFRYDEAYASISDNPGVPYMQNSNMLAPGRGFQPQSLKLMIDPKLGFLRK